jgi:hypothetical protein
MKQKNHKNNLEAEFLEIKIRFDAMLAIETLSDLKCIPCLHVISPYSHFLSVYRRLIRFPRLLSLLTLFFYNLGVALSRIALSLFIGRKAERTKHVQDNLDILVVSHQISNSTDYNISDFYFGDLGSEMTARGITVQFLRIDQTSYYLKRYNGNACREMGICVLPKVASFYEEFIALSRGLALCKELFMVAMKRLVPDTGLSLACIPQAISASTLAVFRIERQISVCIRQLCPKTILITWEGHAWERNVFKVAREIVPSVICIGYVHSVVQKYSHSLWRALGPPFDPDYLLTTGEVPNVRLKEKCNFENCQILVYGTHRAGFEPAASTPRPITRNCLFLPQGEIDECVFMLQFLLETAEKLPEFKFVIRFHPLTKIEKLKNYFSFTKLPLNVLVSSNSLESDIKRASWVVYRGSIAALQAFRSGVRPIYLERPDLLPNDSLYGLNHWKRVVDIPAKLGDILRQDTLASTRIEEFQLVVEHLDQLLCTPRFEVLENLIPYRANKIDHARLGVSGTI